MIELNNWMELVGAGMGGLVVLFGAFAAYARTKKVNEVVCQEQCSLQDQVNALKGRVATVETIQGIHYERK